MAAPAADPEEPNLAFYYPNPVWARGDWVKNLILFFDGIALLVPGYMRDRVSESDPAITAGLEAAGLLRMLEPAELMDQATARELGNTLIELLHSGALKHLPQAGRNDLQRISMSRMGFDADPFMASMVVQELRSQGLAGDEDERSVALHPMVRSLVLVLLAQLLIPGGKRLGLDLSPATDRPDIQASLRELLNIAVLPSAGQVVSRDLELVGVDLASVPLEEILEFRNNNREFRTYARDLREFVREMSLLSESDREQKLKDRAEALSDEADRLRAIARRRWTGQLGVSLAIAGAALPMVAGGLVGLLGGGFALGGMGLAAAKRVGIPPQPEAHSYLFSAAARFPRSRASWWSRVRGLGRRKSDD